MVTYETIKTFPSTSKKGTGKFYTVKKRNDGILTCNCPRWVFNLGGDRTCYHTMAVLAQGADSSVLSGDYQKELKIENKELGRKIRLNE